MERISIYHKYCGKNDTKKPLFAFLATKPEEKGSGAVPPGPATSCRASPDHPRPSPLPKPGGGHQMSLQRGPSVPVSPPASRCFTVAGCEQKRVRSFSLLSPSSFPACPALLPSALPQMPGRPLRPPFPGPFPFSLHSQDLFSACGSLTTL